MLAGLCTDNDIDVNSDLCHNVSIQRGKTKVCGRRIQLVTNGLIFPFLSQRTEVRESKWGLGLFIIEPCAKNELISGALPPHPLSLV